MIFFVLAAAVAAASPSICTRLVSDIELRQMEMADARQASLLDDSAPRATMRAAETTANLLAVQVDMDAMRDHHCAPYSHLVSESAYLSAALSCHTAIMNKVSAGDRTDAKIPECDRSAWKRMGD